MPALRERESDVLELAHVFLKKFSHQYKLPLKSLHPDSVSHLIKHPWPGNIRELENLIHREFLMCDSAQILFGQHETIAHLADMGHFKNAKAQAIAEFERTYLFKVLEQTSGNLSEAARIAGQERSAFGKLARKYGVRTSAIGKEKNTNGI
jgi:DNA-binding NtrC family response regulator